MAPRITLRPINESNWEEAAKLELRPEQEEFIFSNLWSIAESGFHAELHPMAIRNGQTMVGFLMWGKLPKDGKMWLLRFMIDRRWQGSGFGTIALEQLLEEVRDAGVAELEVGFHPDNETAKRLYVRAGFELTGIAHWGELTARKTFQG